MKVTPPSRHDALCLLPMLAMALVLLSGCRDDLGGDTTRTPTTWTIKVYHENGTLVEELTSYMRPTSSDGRTVFRDKGGELGTILNPRGVTVVIPDDPMQ